MRFFFKTNNPSNIYGFEVILYLTLLREYRLALYFAEKIQKDQVGLKELGNKKTAC